jgi:hypothetical protein
MPECRDLMSRKVCSVVDLYKEDDPTSNDKAQLPDCANPPVIFS